MLNANLALLCKVCFYVRFCFSGNDSFCLETQRIPNAINCENLPSPVLKKGEKYYSATEYRFSLIK